MTPRPHRLLLAAITVAGTAAACGADGPTGSRDTTGTTRPSAPTTAVIDPGDGGDYDPVVDPGAFVATIDNPYLPLAVGSRWVYEGDSDGDLERVEVVVTGDRREVMGISATVVRDTVHVGGELVEDTYDWFAQDARGNVWYLGEEVKNYEGGQLTDGAGSWEAGVGGALPGIVMPADPAVGLAYRQEYWPDQAEDLGEVIAVGDEADVPAGRFADVVTTRDWTPLEPDAIEEKQYAAAVGLIRETKVAGGAGLIELIEFAPGG